MTAGLSPRTQTCHRLLPKALQLAGRGCVIWWRGTYMCVGFFLAGSWLNITISMLSSFSQPLLTSRLLVPVQCQDGCASASPSAAALLPEVTRGRKEPKEQHVWTNLGRATTRAEDCSKPLSWQFTAAAEHCTTSGWCGSGASASTPFFPSPKPSLRGSLSTSFHEWSSGRLWCGYRACGFEEVLLVGLGISHDGVNEGSVRDMGCWNTLCSSWGLKQLKGQQSSWSPSHLGLKPVCSKNRAECKKQHKTKQ